MSAPDFDLNLYDHNSLRTMAALHRLAQNRQAKKGELASALSRYFKQPESINKALAALNPLERQVLTLLQMAPVEGLTIPVFLRLAQIVGLVRTFPASFETSKAPPPSQQIDVASVSILQAPARLCALGLAVGWRSQTRSSSYQTAANLDRLDAFGLPDHVRNVLPAPVWEMQTIDESAISTIASGSARSFQRNLFFYWSQVRSQPIQIKQDGFVYKRDLKAINEVLMQPITGLGSEPDHPDLHFLRLMGHSLKLLHSSAGNLIANELPPFFDETPEDRIRKCFENWLAAGWWREPSRYFLTNTETGIVMTVRKRLVDVLKQAPEGPWIDRQSLIMAIAPLLLGAIFGAMDIYTFFYERGSLNEMIADITRLSVYGDPLGDFFAGSLEGPLHWMGLVDIAFGPKQQPIAFRLTPAGVLALGRIAKLDLPAAAGQVIIQPNYHILAIDPVPDATLAALDSFAERQKAGRVTEYELTRASVHQGALGGWPVGRIIEFLQKNTGAPLPGNVLRTLEEWGEGHHRIRFYTPPAVLETATPAETATLHRQPAAAAALGRTMTPTLSLVRDLHALQRAMRDANLMLDRSSADTTADRPVFRLSDDGLLHPATPVIGLGASAGVAAFTEATEAGLLISPRSVQAAAKSGLKSEAITDALRKALAHPLSPEWERRLKTWTAHFGSARTTPRALLELRSAEVLAELRNDPQIARLLKPLQSKHALATFDPADRQRLQELFAHYGIEMTDDLA